MTPTPFVILLVWQDNSKAFYAQRHANDNLDYCSAMETRLEF